MNDQGHTTAPALVDAPGAGGAPVRTVRDAAFDVMRHLGLTTIFGNPGSTEIAFLAGLPDDIRFVLGLHEGSVVGMATGYAMARGEPALVNLHTAPGLGNAVSAIANARDCQVPLVVLVGQQDRRQISYQPFLTGQSLERLAGDYPVWTSLPVQAQDVPGAIARAYHEAIDRRGPAIVVVPMGDWSEPADDVAAGWPRQTARATDVAPADLDALVELIEQASAPALVVGRGSDTPEGWAALVALAERLGCPVWQEPFARHAGFPQDHPLFAGYLGWRRGELREALAPHDLVLAVGISAFRLYILDDPGPLVAAATRVAVLTDDPAEAYRSPSELAVIAPVARACAALAGRVTARASAPGASAGPAGSNGSPPAAALRPAPPALQPPAPGEALTAPHVLSALAQRLPHDAVLVEETPSSQPELYRRMTIRSPGGLIAGGNGWLGFGISGPIGMRMGNPRRPVVAVIGDGASLYNIQALWSAAQYEVGVLIIVMANGRYAVMDNLARAAQAAAPWPGFGAVDVAGIARCLGCPAVNVTSHAQLLETLDDVLPGLAERRGPLLVEVALDGSR